MISFTNPAMLLLAIPLFGLAMLAQRRTFTNLSRRRMRIALAVRLAILAALLLAMAGTHLRLPQSRQAVMFVADLSASDAGQRSAMQSLINQVATQRPGGDVLGVVTAGRQAVADQPVTGLNGFDGFQSAVDAQFTNLAGGLDLANALLPGGYQHRIVLMSDGQQNVGDALATAKLLRSQGVRVDVAPVRVPGGPEVLVDRVDVPSQLRPHESFGLSVVVHSTVRTTMGMTLIRDGSLVGSLQERIHPGDNQYVLPQSPLPPGVHSYRVNITPARDTQPENNQGSAVTTVQSAPRVLVIAWQPREATNVMASLHSTGIQADLRAPAQVTPELSYLQRYASVIVLDTPADVLGPSLMAQLVPFVRDLGHGLVVIGGQNAYSMGGYGQTPLEQALPVSMELPKRRNLPTTAVALIVESLEEDTQINISKEAGKGIVDLLTPQDYIAVSDAPFDESPGWVIPLQHVTSRGAINAAIDRMVPGDPESYTPMLQAAYGVLKRSNARIKHIILLGDGDAEDPSYQQVVEGTRAGGVTVSTVATNGMGRSDAQTMQNIAQWGGGRYYVANDPSKIPQIFLREARTVARIGIVQGKFFPQELSSNPMVRDLTKVAPLYGYIATTPKPAGEMVLVSNKLDPLLAAWQYGLGRSVAWTSDAAGLWSKDWLRAPGANRFWANVVSWTFPPAGTGRLFVSASQSAGEGHVAVTTPAILGANPSVAARVLDPRLHTTAIQLEPSAPGQFSGSFPESGQGAYFVTVEAHGAGHGDAGQVGMDVSYSSEYRTTGVNLPFLQTLAQAGGGSVISRAQDAWLGNLPSVLAEYDLTAWLLLLVVLLLPVDVAVRRLVVSRKELVTIMAALPFWQTAPADTQPAVAPLSALRARRAQRAAVTSQSLLEEAGGVTPRRPRRGIPAGSRPREASADAGEPEEGSIAGKLLAARRNRE